MASGSQQGPVPGGRTILVAVDENEHSKHAFHWLVDNVFRPSDFIVLTHIPESPVLPNLSFKQDGLHLPYEEWKRVIEESINKVNKLQADYEADLIQRKIHYKVTGEHAKNVGAAIIAEAEKNSADLIVVGTRGLGGIKRTVLGSVSDYVVHHSSSIPVLVCPSSKKE